MSLGDRARDRIPTPELNRFLGRGRRSRASRRPKQGRRLKLLYMAQIETRPPRFSIQVNNRKRLTRDYAYFVENRLRERYGLEGVPLVIDFVERKQRRREECTQRGPALVLAGSVALLVGILAIAVGSTRSAIAGPGGEAARIVPAGALAFVRLSTDPDDPAARRLQRLAPRIPGLLALRDTALGAVSLAPGAFDPQRDVRPWLGDEAAVALVDLGGGRFGSLVIAQVRYRPRAEALLQRVAGRGPGALPQHGGPALRPQRSRVRRGFSWPGPRRRCSVVDVARGDAPSLRRLARLRARARGLAAARRGLRLAARAARPRRRRAAARPPAPGARWAQRRSGRARPPRARAQHRDRWRTVPPDARRPRARGRRRARGGAGPRQGGRRGAARRRGRRARRRARAAQGRTPRSTSTATCSAS